MEVSEAFFFVSLVFCIAPALFLQHAKMNLDDIANENNKGHNKNWPYIPDHPYRILVIGSSGSGKTNALLNVIKEQHDDLK